MVVDTRTRSAAPTILAIRAHCAGAAHSSRSTQITTLLM